MILRKFYQKYKCALIIPLVLLILLNAISFILMFYTSNSFVNISIFLVSTLMIVYYSYKQSYNLKTVINLIKLKIKGSL